MSSTKFANAGIEIESNNHINGNGIKNGSSNGNCYTKHENGSQNGKKKLTEITNGKGTASVTKTQEIPLGQIGNVVSPYTYEIIKESADYILQKTTHRPKIGIICGSGLGNLADLLENADTFPYNQIPHFPVSTVSGHEGKLVVGELLNVPVVCMKGRFHFYEGYPLWKVAMPVRVFKLLGVEILIVTNAAGGLNSTYKVGDIMLLKDHFNFPGFGGDSALRGPNDERFGPRFPPVNSAYDAKIRSLAKKVAEELDMSSYIREGVYTMVGGPSYETVAELKAMKTLGIDAVGMSTIPEVIVASHCGIKTLAFSLITNECVTGYDGEVDPSHSEVMEAADKREADLKRFVSHLIPSINESFLAKSN